jgi:hypothetical protein
VLDDTYRAKFARKGWTGEFPLIDSGEVDVFTGPGPGERFFVVAAMPVPSTTLRKFTADHVEVMSGFALCKKARAFRNTRLGGVAAREFTQRCLFHDAFVVTAIRRGRGYTFQYVADKENPASVDRPVFEAGRRTFRFTS